MRGYRMRAWCSTYGIRYSILWHPTHLLPFKLQVACRGQFTPAAHPTIGEGFRSNRNKLHNMQYIGTANRNVRLLLTVPLLTLGIVASMGTTGQCQTAPAKPSANDIWTSQLLPLLDKKCLKCHAGVRQQGGLDLRSLDTILRGGENGPEIVPGGPDASRMLQYVTPPSGPHMPPDKSKQFTPAEVAILRHWIAALPSPASRLTGTNAKGESSVAAYLTEYRRLTRSTLVAPAGLSGSETIDWFLTADWKRLKQTPAAPAPDNVYLRRIYLDLAGRIPTRTELQQFMSDKSPAKRRLLVEKLTRSYDYARYLREIFDTALMGRPRDAEIAKQRAGSGWNSYIESCFTGDVPWNRVVHDILVARPSDAQNRGAVWFLAERNNSYQAIAEATAPLVYGVQIKCAQCHNHPLAWEIEQKHYWGLVAVFNRSSNMNTPSGLQIGESAIGGFINFANLKKQSQPASLVFINGKSVSERIPGPNEKEVDSPTLYSIPPGAKAAGIPLVSRREEFADAAIKDNPMLARSFVNRIWASLMGRGFVEPVDEIDSRHPAVHPELFDWLAHDFEANGYQVKRLIKSIVLSKAYQLDSLVVGKTAPPPESFARFVEKPLTGEQIYRSLVIATGTTPDPATAGDRERAFITAFPDLMPETYSPSLQQALFLNNSPVVDAMLKPVSGNTLSLLLAIPSPEQRIREAFLYTLGRSPDAMEMQQCLAALKQRSPSGTVNSANALKNLLWALTTGSEFKVNH